MINGDYINGEYQPTALETCPDCDDDALDHLMDGDPAVASSTEAEAAVSLLTSVLEHAASARMPAEGYNGLVSAFNAFVYYTYGVTPKFPTQGK